MLEVSIYGVGTVLRLERGARSTVKTIWKTTMRTHDAPPIRAFVRGRLLSNVTDDVNILWKNLIFI